MTRHSSVFKVGALAATGVVAALLSACSGSSSDSWFPLSTGQGQVFRVTQIGDEPVPEGRWRTVVVRQDQLDDQSVAVRRHSEGVEFYLRADEQGVRRVATRTDVDSEPARDAEPRWVLKAPYTVGTEWSTPTVPYLLTRRNEYPRELKYSHTVTMQWRIEAVDEEVITPAGTFKPCLRVLGQAKLSLYTDPVNGFNDVPLISREWYCKGQGLVRFEREEKVPSGFLQGGVLTAELLELTR